MPNKIVVVTRHKALVELLLERNIINEGKFTLIEHATPKEVAGKDVIGVLPLRLAALADSVTEIPLALTPEDRGVELPIERLRQIAGDAVTYRVTEIGGGL